MAFQKGMRETHSTLPGRALGGIPSDIHSPPVLSPPASASHWPYPRGSQKTKELTDTDTGESPRCRIGWKRMGSRYEGKMEDI